MDALVEEFLKEEKEMVDKLDSDKRRALAYPDSHREYTAEWNYFYKKRYVRLNFEMPHFMGQNLLGAS